MSEQSLTTPATLVGEPRVERLTSVSQAGVLVLLTVALLAAFALRAYRLDGQSLWSDEFISLERTSQPLGQMLATMPAEHAPLYFLVLHFWLHGAGAATDFAVRFLSVACSVLAVALAYHLGRRVLGREGGLWIAFLLAVNPFQVWYAQEARMYAILLVLGLASVDALLSLLGVRGWRVEIGDSISPSSKAPIFQPAAFNLQFWLYVLATAAMLYTHYYAFLLLGVEWAFAAWYAWRRDRAVWRRFLAAQLGAALLFLPWVPRLVGLLEFPGWRPPLDVTNLPARYFEIYMLGTSLPEEIAGPLGLGFVALAVAGVAWLGRRAPTSTLPRFAGEGADKGGHGGTAPTTDEAAAASWAIHRRDSSVVAAAVHDRSFAGEGEISNLALPLIACYLLVWLAGGMALAVRKPDFHERYFMMLTPGLYLAVAAGAEALRRAVAPALRWAPALGVAGFVLAASAWSLDHHYYDPAYAKPDYRAVARTMATRGTPDDGLILNGPERAYLGRYYPGTLPEQANLAGSRYKGKEDEGRARLAGIAARHHQLWLAVEFRGHDYVQEWLDRNGYQVERFATQDITLYRYSFPSDAGPLRQPGDTRTAGQVALDGYRLAPDPVPAGQVAHLALEWRATAIPAADYKVALRLVDPNGREWIAVDRPPVDGFAPTSTWKPGETVEDRYGLPIPADLPAGQYPLQVRLYHEGSWAEAAGATLGPLRVVGR